MDIKRLLLLIIERDINPICGYIDYIRIASSHLTSLLNGRWEHGVIVIQWKLISEIERQQTLILNVCFALCIFSITIMDGWHEHTYQFAVQTNKQPWKSFTRHYKVQHMYTSTLYLRVRCGTYFPREWFVTLNSQPASQLPEATRRGRDRNSSSSNGGRWISRKPD